MTSPLTAIQRAAISDQIAASISEPIPVGTERSIHGVASMLGKAVAVIGMRRAGKTMYLHQIRRTIVDRTPSVMVPYVNFEDERLLGLSSTDLNVLIEEFERHAQRSADPSAVAWFLDEIQNVPGWERFVRRLLDGGYVVYVSGSSAAMLSREIATSLRGRAWEVPIFPFSFREYLAHHGSTLHRRSSYTPKERTKLELLFRDYLNSGGFPEAQGLEAATRSQLLRDYVDVAMLRDVVERHNVSNVAGLRWLVRHLLGNAAGSFSIERFYASMKSQGLSISRDSLHALLAHLEDCYLIRTIWMESASERQRMVNPRKIYPIDQGLIPLYDRTGRANLGHALETAVVIEAQRRRCELTYVKTGDGYEVDLLVREPSGRTHLVQVCADASSADTSAREFRAIEEARKVYRSDESWLLTADRSGKPSYSPGAIHVTTAYEWMLAENWG